MSEGAENKREFLERLSAVLDLMGESADERERGRDFARLHTKVAPVRPDWDEYFHAIAQVVALKSKDMSRKVGAVVVGQGNVILSTGFNGLPRGVREAAERMLPKEEKYRWITHAETNAIFNAARSGTSLVDGTLYVTTFPCGSCAQAIVQSGIRRLFTYGEYWKNDPNGYEKALEILAEGHVLVDAPRVRGEDAGLRRAKGVMARATEVELPGAVANDGRSEARSEKAAALTLKKATTDKSRNLVHPRKRAVAGRR